MHLAQVRGFQDSNEPWQIIRCGLQLRFYKSLRVPTSNPSTKYKNLCWVSNSGFHCGHNIWKTTPEAQKKFRKWYQKNHFCSEYWTQIVEDPAMGYEFPWPWFKIIHDFCGLTFCSVSSTIMAPYVGTLFLYSFHLAKCSSSWAMYSVRKGQCLKSKGQSRLKGNIWGQF